jgi:glycosyltransferase involved in cell wall biosynthesis
MVPIQGHALAENFLCSWLNKGRFTMSKSGTDGIVVPSSMLPLEPERMNDSRTIMEATTQRTGLTPWLSILVPVYNVAAYLEECLSSVCRGLRPGVEVCVLDDASTDGSAAIIARFAAAWPSALTVISLDRNGGLGEARNRLAQAARGRYLWHIDADDVLRADALEMLEPLAGEDGADLIMCDFRMLRERSGIKHTLRGEMHRRTFAGKGRDISHDRSRLVEGLFLNGQLHSWSKIARREIWQQVEFPSGRYFEDIAVMPQLLDRVRSWQHVDETWIGYRQRPGSILAASSPSKLRDNIAALDDLRRGLLDTDLTVDSRTRFALLHFVLKSQASLARKLRSEGHSQDSPECALLQQSINAWFPDGVRDQLSAYRRRGWLFRERRTRRSLGKAGIEVSPGRLAGPEDSAIASTGSNTPPHDQRIRVLHFVTGGFSGGATRVAIGLVEAAQANGRFEPLLVLRRKRGIDPRHIAGLRARGIPFTMVSRWPHLATVLELAWICRKFRPHVLVAHGYSEHLWGRYAGLLAGVRNLVHVEHNTRERYSSWRLAQSRWLARRTQAIVGCSEGVREVLLGRGAPPARTLAIPNGISLEPFAEAELHPYAAREPGLVMVARLSRQKDHATLLQALALLGARGLRPVLTLAGGGKPEARRHLEVLADSLGISDQVRFLGVCKDVPALLLANKVAVLSTHYEGMPLALLEGMAAGCAVIGSDVPGVREILRHGENGWLVKPADPVALADRIEHLLTHPELAEQTAAAGRSLAQHRYGLATMNLNYENLFLSLCARTNWYDPAMVRWS